MLGVHKKKTKTANNHDTREYEDTIKVSFLTFGEIAVLFNAILIIVGIYIWVKPIVTAQSHKISAQQSHIEQIDSRIALDFDITESEFRNTALILSNNFSVEGQTEHQILFDAANPITKFDQIYWVKKHANKLKVIPLINVSEEESYRDIYNFNINAPNKDVISSFLKPLTKIARDEIHINLVPNYSSMFTKKIGPNKSILIQPFILGQKVYGHDNSFLGFVIGVTRSNKAFGVESFGAYSNLTYMTVTEEDSGVTLLAYSYKIDSLMRLFGKEDTRDNTLEKWNGRKFSYNLVTILHVGNTFLEVALNVFLIIGALYATFLFSLVRNNRIRRVRA
ncbi:MAG: hypothetical protein VX740_08720, partial [Pseudomonadota bacterium]|nr:hypothetical protein [Pseudomonadota bacterium]